MDSSSLNLTQAVEWIREGRISSEEYTKCLLKRCEQAKSLNAFILLAPERVLAEAREADRKQRGGQELGPLHGIPIVIKDGFDVAGTPTTAGTPALQHNVVKRTGPMLQRLFDAGAIMLGKTNMHELAYGITSSNEHTGAVRNPHNQSLSPGGSSGGTAAAVAAGLAPAGVAADTSGSVRIPAAHCGIFGYRPSTGRYSGKGIFPLFHTRDTAGFMARTVRDIALLDEVVSGERTLPEIELRGMRLGLPGDYFFADLDSRVARIIETEINELQALGVEFIEADPPDFGKLVSESTGAIKDWEMPRDVAEYLDEVGMDITFESLVDRIASPYVKAELDDLLQGAGAADLEDRYNHAISEVIPQHQAKYRAYLTDNDLQAIAFPTTPLAPTPLGADYKVNVDGKEISVWRTLRNTLPATLLRAPCISLPAGLSEDGLPIGLELDGLPDADRNLLSIGMAWECARPGIPMPRI